MNTTTNTEANTDSTAHAMEVAKTILAQINGLDFWARARWGVKQALALGSAGAAGLAGLDKPGIQFNCNKGIKIRIILDRSDTYSIEIGRLRGMNYSKKDEASDVYAEDLVRIIDGMFSKAFGSL